MATNVADKEVEKLRAEMDTLRADLARLTEQLSRTAKAGASAASDSAREEYARLREEMDRVAGIVGDRSRQGMHMVQDQVETHPFVSLGAAFGVGFLLGKLLDRR